MKPFRAVSSLLILCASFAIAQTPQLDLLLTVQDNAGGSRQLHFGIDPAATDSLDAALGEKELPPSPPSMVFDARFVGDDIGVTLGEGSIRDYRFGVITDVAHRVYEVKYQVGLGTSITIAWQLPLGVAGRLQDVIVGSLVDVPMTGTGSFTIADPFAYPTLKLTVSYALSSPIVAISNFEPMHFESTRLGTVSPSQFYLVSGKNLTADIVAKSPPGFELSLNDTSFTDSVSISPIGGSVSSTILHLRFHPTVPGLLQDSIIHKSNGAATTYLLVTGTGIDLPSVRTGAVTSVGATEAGSGGEVITDGSSPVTARGLCWGTALNPTIEGHHSIDQSGTGMFTTVLSGLQAGIMYHERAYATNAVGTAYGADSTFVTAPESPVAKPASAIQTTRFTASWDSVFGASSYRLDVSQDSLFSQFVDGFAGLNTGSLTSMPVANLLPVHVYYYRVRAVNSRDVASANSNIIGPVWTSLDSVSITFRLDLSVYEERNVFRPDRDSAMVRFAIDSSGRCVQALGNGLYSASMKVRTGSTTPYKYWISSPQGSNSGWEGLVRPGSPSGDRVVTVGQTDTVLGKEFFNNIEHSPGSDGCVRLFAPRTEITGVLLDSAEGRVLYTSCDGAGKRHTTIHIDGFSPSWVRSDCDSIVSVGGVRGNWNPVCRYSGMTQVLYLTDRDGACDLRSYSTATRQDVLLKRYGGDSTLESFSRYPTGEALVASVVVSGRRSIRFLTESGETMSTISIPLLSCDAEPDWTADGSDRILFNRNDTLFTIRRDGSDLQVEFVGPGPLRHARWSPNGKRICFSLFSESWRISILDPSTGVWGFVTEPFFDAFRPEWDRKSGRIVYLTTKDSTAISPWATLPQESVTGISSQSPMMAAGFSMEQNYPNPFNPKTVIRVSVPPMAGRDLVSNPVRDGQWTVDSRVRLAVYDVLGREVAVLANGRYPAGRYSFTFDGANLASGVYFYRLTAGSFSAVRKMLLTR